MTHPKPDPASGLIDVSLAQAKNALTSHNLTDTKKFFKDALNVNGEHPTRPDRIRALIKEYCNQYLTESPVPPWDKLRQALALITELELQNKESQVWGRKIQLQYTKHLLSQDEVDHCFEQFEAILDSSQDEDEQYKILHDEITPQIRNYISKNIQGTPNWEYLINIVKRLEILWPKEQKSREWLETMQIILQAANIEHQKLNHANNLILQTTNEMISASKWNKRFAAIIFIISIAACIAIFAIK